MNYFMAICRLIKNPQDEDAFKIIRKQHKIFKCFEIYDIKKGTSISQLIPYLVTQHYKAVAYERNDTSCEKLMEIVWRECQLHMEFFGDLKHDTKFKPTLKDLEGFSWVFRLEKI